MKISLPPLNRLVAFVGPYIALASGALSSWLVVHVKVIGSLGLGQDKLAHGVAYAATALVGAAIPHLGMQKWLDGHQQFTGQVLNVIELLDPDAQRQVAAALPGANGDLLRALESVLVIPQSTADAALGGVHDADTSGDVEEDNGLVDVEASPLDEVPPPASFGDDRVHAPAGAEPPGGAAGAQAAATIGGAA